MAWIAAPLSRAASRSSTSTPAAWATSERKTSGAKSGSPSTPASTTTTSTSWLCRRSRRYAYSPPLVSSVPTRTTVARLIVADPTSCRPEAATAEGRLTQLERGPTQAIAGVFDQTTRREVVGYDRAAGGEGDLRLEIPDSISFRVLDRSRRRSEAAIEATGDMGTETTRPSKAEHEAVSTQPRSENVDVTSARKVADGMHRNVKRRRRPRPTRRDCLSSCRPREPGAANEHALRSRSVRRGAPRVRRRRA